MQCWLKSGILVLALGIFVQPMLLQAQAEDCPAHVYYGEGGTDVGDCSNDAAALCESHAYALQQGQARCSSEVLVFGDGSLRETYRRSDGGEQLPMDLAITGLYWIAPLLLGGLGGWLAARQLRHRPRQAAADDREQELQRRSS